MNQFLICLLNEMTFYDVFEDSFTLSENSWKIGSTFGFLISWSTWL